MSEVIIRAFQSDPLVAPPFIAPLPAVPFSRWKLQEARQFLAQMIPAERTWALGMYNGDHWQGGWGWAGPMVSQDDPNWQRLWNEILKMFCSRNVIKEIVDTHINAVLGRPMKWSLIPIRASADERDDTPDELKTLIAEASVFVRQWLESRNAHALMRSLLLEMLLPPGSATARLWLPRGGGMPITEGSRVLGVTVNGNFAATMARIYAEKVDIRNGRVYTDHDTMRDVGIAFFKTRANGGGMQDAANLSFLDESGERTITTTLYQDGGSTASGYRMGGRLTMYEVKRDPLITNQLLQQQRILNYAESIIPRTLTTAGFLDRILSGIQLNGEWETDEDGGESYIIDPDAIPRFGPAEVTVLQPVQITDDDGRITLTKPEVIRGEPVVPTGAIASSDHLYFNMLRESGLGHLVPNEESDSAKIRYGLSLLASAVPLTAAYQWLIGGALAWAEALAGTPGKYTDRLRIQTSCFLNVGPLSPEQRDSLVRAFEKSLLARETVQAEMGVEDVDQENDTIAAQPGAAIDLAIRQANAFKMLREAGLPPRVAAIRSGYSETEADEMQQEFETEQARVQQQTEKQLTLEAKLAPKPVAGTGSAGLNAKRKGRPSGTAERNPGQQQDRGARAQQSKQRNRTSP